MDITTILIDKLHEDLAASQMDEKTCERLIFLAPDDKKPSLRERITGNRKIITVIETELQRRKEG